MSFTELAQQRLLSAVGPHLTALTWDVEPDGYQRVRVPPTADVDPLLRLLQRRGLEPALAAILLERFAPRPLERALIAWDIASDSLLGADDAALIEQLRAHIAPLKELGTSQSVAVPRDRIEALSLSATALGEHELPGASVCSLAAVATGAAPLEAALDASQRFARAQLPSLALAYAQLAWARHHADSALDAMVELVLDAERFDSMPPMTSADEASLVRQTYFGMRVALAQHEPHTASAVFEQMKTQFPAVANSAAISLQLTRVEAALLSDAPLEYGTEDRFKNLDHWRYAVRVTNQLRIQRTPENTTIWVEDFLTSFGNDLRVWAQAGLQFDARAAMLALSSREIRYQPWDPNAWRSLIALIDDDPSAIELELEARSEMQLAAALR